ncbi:potassium voltage-gated channel subfamily KQT [Vibrio ishigakensis]|uniref:Potassium voltage-gated channel subfamily KQT n=1 Tax=Vibrio ishigakensis TaxID=1481914 RepID=A0A0B8QRN9_9VIBR|nr:potassium voltage-gated channel subfamily KQT [Vibrio ishigakensis]
MTMPHPEESLRYKLYVIIFRTDTPAGRAFDIALIVTILASLFVLIMALSAMWLKTMPLNLAR